MQHQSLTEKVTARFISIHEKWAKEGTRLARIELNNTQERAKDILETKQVLDTYGEMTAKESDALAAAYALICFWARPNDPSEYGATVFGHVNDFYNSKIEVKNTFGIGEERFMETEALRKTMFARVVVSIPKLKELLQKSMDEFSANANDETLGLLKLTNSIIESTDKQIAQLASYRDQSVLASMALQMDQDLKELLKKAKDMVKTASAPSAAQSQTATPKKG